MNSQDSHAASRSRLAACEGTTLIELVLVLLILGLLAGVAGPRMFGALAGDIGDDLYVQEVLSSVQYAQKLAVGTGCRVQLDFSASSYLVTQETGCAGGVFGLGVRDPATGSTPFSGTAPTGISLGSSVDPVLFDALGRATNSGAVVSDVAITVGGRSISVAGETGFAWTP